MPWLAHLRVGEEEDSALVLHTSLLVQLLEVIMEGRVVIASTQLDLETLAAVYVRSHSKRDTYNLDYRSKCTNSPTGMHCWRFGLFNRQII